MLNLKQKIVNTRFAVNTLLLAAAGITAAALHDKKTALKVVDKIEKSKSLFADQGANIAIGDASIGLVIAAVTMGIGAMILSKIFPQVQGTDETSNNTIASIKSTTWDSISLLPIALIVFAAVVIIGVVMYLRQ